MERITLKEINKQKNESITWLRKEVKRLQKENDRLKNNNNKLKS